MHDTPLPVQPARPHPSSLFEHLSLLVVTGPDARAFVDTQLTRNVTADPADPAGAAPVSLAGYCSPKGRLLASFVLWNDGDRISLLVSRDIADAVAKRLRMYVLRAKVTIDDASSVCTICGSLDPPFPPSSVAAIPAWTSLPIDGRTWIRYPDVDGRKRFLTIDAAPGNVDADSRRPDTDAVDAVHWRWLDIRSGLPWITAMTQDRFVPQMLNLEALNAVDFKKGCFPGQEIVARSQYLGKLKRRMTLASTDATANAAPGTDVWQPDGHEPCGLVVNAEPGPDGRIALLAEMPLALFAAADLRLGTADGPVLTIEALPYALPDNEVFVRPKL